MTYLQQAFISTFQELARDAHNNSRNKGFWDTSDKLQTAADKAGLGKEMHLMRNSQLRDLMVSELGEACEGERKDLQSEKIPGFSNAEEEYADLVIRLLDMSHGRGLRIAEAVVAKMDTTPHALQCMGGRTSEYGKEHRQKRKAVS